LYHIDKKWRKNNKQADILIVPIC